MRRLLIFLLVIAFASPLLPGRAQNTGDTLYKKLGGYDAIAAVTDDFIGRLATDPKLKEFFTGVSEPHRARIRQLVVDLICQKTGGPCIYTGSDLGEVHKGMHISEDQWNAAIADFGATAKKFNIPSDQLAQLADLFNQVKPQIVNK